MPLSRVILSCFFLHACVNTYFMRQAGTQTSNFVEINNYLLCMRILRVSSYQIKQMFTISKNFLTFVNSLHLTWTSNSILTRVQLIMFGDKTPVLQQTVFEQLTFIRWVEKVKYLNWYIVSCSHEIRLVYSNIRKFYGQFNNICQYWANILTNWLLYIQSNRTAYQRYYMGVKRGVLLKRSCAKPVSLWNNSFRRMFSCCWRESVKLYIQYIILSIIAFILYCR